MIKAILVGVIVVLVMMVTGYGQTPTRADLLATIKHIETLAQETQQDLDAEKAAHAQTKAALENAIRANHDTEQQFKSYQAAAESEIKKGNDAIAALAGVVKKLHRAKWILCAEWLAVCAFLALQVSKMPGLGTYALLGVAALAAAGCSAIWLWV